MMDIKPSETVLTGQWILKGGLAQVCDKNRQEKLGTDGTCPILSSDPYPE